MYVVAQMVILTAILVQKCIFCARVPHEAPATSKEDLWYDKKPFTRRLLVR